MKFGEVVTPEAPLPTEHYRVPDPTTEIIEDAPKKKKKAVPRAPLSSLLPDHLMNKVIPFGCSDKKINDKWTPDRNFAAFPQPFRAMFLGPPNVGKSTLAKTLITYADPPFDELYIIHEDYQPDGGGTTEWDDADPTRVMGEVPDLKWWDDLYAADDPDEPPVRRLIVIDDLEATGVSKARERSLVTLYRYVSSHHGASLILCYQNMFGIKPILRKMANVIVCWRPTARNEMGIIANRVGIEEPELRLLFDQANRIYGRSIRNSICFDATQDTPAPIRINLFQPVILPEKTRRRKNASVPEFE